MILSLVKKKELPISKHYIPVLLAVLSWSGIFQYHSQLGITPFEQVQDSYHGNLVVVQEKFDGKLD